jgi:hypothetical protein
MSLSQGQRHSLASPPELPIEQPIGRHVPHIEKLSTTQQLEARGTTSASSVCQALELTMHAIIKAHAYIHVRSFK